MDSCYTKDPVIRTNLRLPTASYKSSSSVLDFSRGHERKKTDTRKQTLSSLDFIIERRIKSSVDVDSLDRNVSRGESTSITIGYGCCGSTWLLGELKAADEQAVFAPPRQDKAWRGAGRSIGRVFQNQVLFYYGRANKFFQSWPLRYRPPFEIKRSHPVELSWFDSVFFEYLSTVRGKSCRENSCGRPFPFSSRFFLFSFWKRDAPFLRLVIRSFDRKAGTLIVTDRA